MLSHIEKSDWETQSNKTLKGYLAHTSKNLGKKQEAIHFTDKYVMNEYGLRYGYAEVFTPKVMVLGGWALGKYSDLDEVMRLWLCEAIRVLIKKRWDHGSLSLPCEDRERKWPWASQEKNSQ